MKLSLKPGDDLASSCWKRNSRGISSLHGAHQAAQKFTQVKPPPIGRASGSAASPAARFCEIGFLGTARPGAVICPAHSVRGGLGAALAAAGVTTAAVAVVACSGLASTTWLRSSGALTGFLSLAMSQAKADNARPNTAKRRALIADNPPRTRKRCG